MNDAVDCEDLCQPPRDGTVPLKNDEIGPEDIWLEPAARLLARLNTSAAGLSTAEVRARLSAYGPTTPQRSSAHRSGFSSCPVLVTRWSSSCCSPAACQRNGDIASSVIIVCIILISIVFDFVQEVRAQNAVEALRRSVAVQATVHRDGATASVAIDQMVPGDIVELIAGDLVPADSRLLESRDLYVNQALLTGEPYPAEKQASDAADGEENPAGASNAVFAGTS